MGVTAQKERGGVMGAASSGATSMRRAVWPAANSAARDQMHRESTAPADEALMSQKSSEIRPKVTSVCPHRGTPSGFEGVRFAGLQSTRAPLLSRSCCDPPTNPRLPPRCTRVAQSVCMYVCGTRRSPTDDRARIYLQSLITRARAGLDVLARHERDFVSSRSGNLPLGASD